jgi:hypothetical protein
MATKWQRGRSITVCTATPSSAVGSSPQRKRTTTTV